MSRNIRPEQTLPARWKRPARRVAQWVVLFALWVALSGEIVAEFLVIGALAAAGAIAFSELLFRGTHEGKFAAAPTGVAWHLSSALRFLLYLPRLSYEIIVANLHVAYLVLHPRMPIDPSLVEFETTLVSERAQVALAQSITLTPGTVTVDASDGKFLVHCLSLKAREGLAAGSLQAMIASVFEEPKAERVELTDIVRAGQVPL